MQNSVKQINLDCDGTFVDLYGVTGWLDDIHAHNARPYREARPLVNLSALARAIHQAQVNGWRVCVISWLARTSNAEYDRAVTEAKREWLNKHLPSVEWDGVAIVPYGTPKSQCGVGVLFDDEQRNREEWASKGGVAFGVDGLVEQIRRLTA